MHLWSSSVSQVCGPDTEPPFDSACQPDIEAGWIGRDAILMTGINALFYTASSIVP